MRTASIRSGTGRLRVNSPATNAPLTRSGTPPYAWLCVGLLWVVWLLNYLDRQVIFSVFPLLQAELKLTPVQLGLISTAFLWVYAVAGPFAGYFADRFGCKRMIVVSLAVWSAVTWLTGQARTLPELLAARALMGISEACYLPAALALIAAWHSEKMRAKATGLHYSGGYLGMIIGGGLGGWMAQHYGWRTAFLILGGIGVAYSFVLAFTLRDRKREQSIARSPSQSFLSAARSVFQLPGYPSMFAVFASISVGNWIVYTWLPLYLFERFGMSLDKAGFTATFYLQAGSFAGILIGGAVADRWVLHNPRARLLTQAIGLAAAAPFLFLSGFTSSVVLLTVGMAIFGLGRGIYDANCMPALCQIAPETLRGTGFGMFNFIGPFTGGIVAAGAGALKSSIGIGGSLEIAGVLVAISALVLARVSPGLPVNIQRRSL
jgi:MFS transporter, Spinster family, sphingosine-1-phosphate transporter